MMSPACRHEYGAMQLPFDLDLSNPLRRSVLLKLRSGDYGSAADELKPDFLRSEFLRRMISAARNDKFRDSAPLHPSQYP